MAHLSDRELGIALAFQFQRRPDLPPQALQAMIQDLLSNDTSMRAPLRELTQSPIFLRARPLAGFDRLKACPTFHTSTTFTACNSTLVR